MDHMASERVCYVHCNFCNTILAVSVPCSSMQLAVVTVRCGHCANLLSVNVAGAAPAAAPSDFQTGPAISSSPLFPPNHDHHFGLQLQRQYQPDQQGDSSRTNIRPGLCSLSSSSSSCSSSSSSSPYSPCNFNNAAMEYYSEHEPAPRTPPIRPPERRQRVPSAYNRFIKEEIQRIKASNPDISHREAFSLAAKNWAHFPRIHFGLNLGGQAIPGEGT